MQKRAGPDQKDIQELIALYNARRLKDAEKRARQLIKKFPGTLILFDVLGAALAGQDKTEEAAACSRSALKIDPGYFVAHNNLGIALKNLGKLDEAAASFRQALKIKPDYAEAHCNLGNVLKNREDFYGAAASFQRALRIRPDLAEAHNNLGIVQKALGRYDDAIASYRQALALRPGYAEAHFNLGNLLRQTGRFDEAIASYEETIRLRPDHAEAYHSITGSRKYAAADRSVADMEALYRSSETTPKQKQHLAFALGKAYEDLGDYDKSFEHRAEANRLKRESYAYSSEQARHAFERIRKAFSARSLSSRARMKLPPPTPVFIVGMPRSGTSLVEQMLASHRQVFGAGELNDLFDIVQAAFRDRGLSFPGDMEVIDEAALEHAARAYLDRLKRYSGEAPFVTDKLPHNFLNIGLIARIFPEARIIHIRRSPMDTCFSIYANSFEGDHPYGYELTELGGYYRLYEAMMDHWREVVPDAMIEVAYETLVEEPEREIRRMLDYCGLAFDPACLDFHKTDRPVHTVSSWQVRQPLYRDSVARWRHFEKHLEPLRAALEG